MIKKIKVEKGTSLLSGLSGGLSFLGGYQVCHSICLGLITLLSLVGITIVGMPLLFLQKVAIPFWIAAVFLLAVTLIFYFKNQCISKNLIIFNSGIIIAGIPFKSLQDYSIIFWIIGGSIVFLSMLFLLKDKLKNKQIFK